MSMGDAQKKLRRWFQQHGWHTSSPPTGQGFWLESPVENCAGMSYSDRDPKTGQIRQFSWERSLLIELDRFTCDYVTLSIYKRRHWWKRDNPSDIAPRGYSWIPSDDFEDWSNQPTASINIPAKDIVKLAELITAAQSDWMKDRKTKNHLNFKKRISKSCVCRWIGVNSSYDEIKQTYSNDRIRQEIAERENET